MYMDFGYLGVILPVPFVVAFSNASPTTDVCVRMGYLVVDQQQKMVNTKSIHYTSATAAWAGGTRSQVREGG